MMNTKKAEMIEKKANETRQKLKKPNKCNINIKELIQLIQTHNIRYLPQELPNNISGASMTEESGKQIIVVNKDQPEKRRKFTIAHELGHLILGHDTPLNTQDKAIVTHNHQLNNPSQILFRNDKTSEGSDWKEVEANHFAASLLMPKDLLNKEISKLMQNSRNYLSEYNVHELAEIFGVSAISMGIRLSRLGFM